MTHQDIVAHLCQKHPPEVIHEISSREIYAEIVRRMGEEALELSTEDLELARDEVKAVLEHHLDEREYIDIGLDAWEITAAYNPNTFKEEPMLLITWMETLSLKLGLLSSMPWPELIQATGIMATFKLFIDLAMKLIAGN